MTTAQLVAALDRHLCQQAEAVRRGDLQAAMASAPTIDKLVTRLRALGTAPGRGPAAQEWQRLRDRAAISARLLQAARAGVARARRLIAEGNAPTGFSGYDAHGRSLTIGGATPRQSYRR